MIFHKVIMLIRKIAETEVDRNKEVDLTNYSLEELVELERLGIQNNFK